MIVIFFLAVPNHSPLFPFHIGLEIFIHPDNWIIKKKRIDYDDCDWDRYVCKTDKSSEEIISSIEERFRDIKALRGTSRGVDNETRFNGKLFWNLVESDLKLKACPTLKDRFVSWITGLSRYQPMRFLEY